MISGKLVTGMLLCLASIGAQDYRSDTRKVSQAEAVRQALAKPQPLYPDIARQLKLEGKVEVEASISEHGVVDEVKILNGNAVLTSAAATAMKKWRFQPFTEGGKPVRAIAVLSFTFRL